MYNPTIRVASSLPATRPAARSQHQPSLPGAVPCSTTRQARHSQSSLLNPPRRGNEEEHGVGEASEGRRLEGALLRLMH